MPHSSPPPPTAARPARPVTAEQGFLRAWAALVPAALGVVYFLWRAPDVDLPRLQLAGTAAAAKEVYDGHAPAFRDALVAHMVWVACGAATLLLVFQIGHHAYSGLRGRQVSYWAMIATFAGAVFGLVENGLLVGALRVRGPVDDWPFATATALETVKWLLLGASTVIGARVWATTVSRAGRGMRRKAEDPEPAPVLDTDGADATTGAPHPRHPTDTPRVVPPWPVADADGRIWPTGVAHPHTEPGTESAHWRYQSTTAPGRQHAKLGFCVSGGGIRSATVTLGALQALRRSLREARYLVSVSGGGYTAGAMQLALDDTLTSRDAFAPGSPEEDHLRRHSKYVADGTGQWMVALGVLLRGLLASLFLLAAATGTIGLILSWAYHDVPVTDLTGLAEPGIRFCSHCTATPARPSFRDPAVWTVAYALVAAAGIWLLWLAVYVWDRADQAARWLARAFQAFVVLTLALTAVVFVLPLLAWSAVYLQTRHQVSRPDATVGAGLTVLVTYCAALVGTLWRRRKTVRTGLSKVMDAVRGRSGLTRAVPNGLLQYLTVWVVLILLTAVFLLLLGWATATGWAWPLWMQICVPAVLVFIGSLLDQTWMSLHPFYRRRLASAFAVRREVLPGTEGTQVARPYDFATETTTLSEYGARKPDFPQVIFAAAGNLSGSERTPPGRRAVSYTLSHDYVGGPDVGYACTACLEQRSKRHIARDLTVQSAVAISGAAFASAMGAQARAFQVLFALSNARLGSWLPNPGAVAEQWSAPRWPAPPAPLIRRLPYLLREVFGRYPMDDRLLLVTDGGHYENLGLVELLRQGVRTAVCIDASGDSPPFATTLAQAIALAQEELGITITLHEPTTLVPGSGDPLEPPSVLSALNSRLSRTLVVTGDITYPEDLDIDGDRGRQGTLIVARATLTKDLPYELLSYAAAHPVFPHDSTSDQWFDHRQFDAYQTLGRCLGKRVQELLDGAEAS
ncbi:patatin-like phospholipase family protein [Streptomyces sp. TLI_146]|uniref:patatin-like phospholipase family protein n=1 Tax=Streptomyces sp. TLI_146 TaxID=1938858 RepID=UPI000C70ECDD|nr:patatin-like phospholipase family protein [Streptomyces sp. TLI_146]PKV89436.1 hypothetical protein BX283_7072 [Streptomyces sp. TLI_146]